MARVTSDEVKEIINSALTNLIPFIAAANTLVTDELSGLGLSATRLKEIERWLAAHLVAVSRDRSLGQVVEKEIGKTREKYMSFPSGLAINSSSYGQQAALLDTTGTLANLGRKKAAFRVVTPSLT